MIAEANTKNVYLLASGTVATNATATASIDTRGYDYAQLHVHMSVTTAASVLKVEQSDDDSTYVACNLTGGTDFTIVAHGTATSTAIPYYSFNVDTRGLRRYLKLSITPGASATILAYATLGRRNVSSPSTGQGASVDARAIVSV